MHTKFIGSRFPSILAVLVIYAQLDEVAAQEADFSLAGDWNGLSLGASIGRVTRVKDFVEVSRFDATGNFVGQDPGTFPLDFDGTSFGVHGRYLWGGPHFYYGAALSFDTGNITKDAEQYLPTLFERLESRSNYTASLKAVFGYAADQNALVYGTAGIIYGNFSYSYQFIDASGAFSDSDTYDDVGYSLGLGFASRLTEKTSLYAEWDLRFFGANDVALNLAPGGSFVSNATPSHDRISVGVSIDLD